MPRLYIAEKPSVAEVLAQTLGGAKKCATHWTTESGDMVTWAIGHLVSLSAPEDYNPAWKDWSVKNLPMLPDKFVWKPASANAAKRLDEIEMVIKLVKPTSIVNACDAGREGELIFRLIWTELGLKETVPMERLWLRSMTKEGIKAAIAQIEPADKYRNLAKAAAIRAIADWTVGMNATRAISHVMRQGLPRGEKSPLFSIGRVQTPTLALVVDYDSMRKQFKPETSFKVSGDFGPLTASVMVPGEAQAAAIKQACEGQPAVVTSTSVVENRPPNPLFDLTTLQRFTNVTMGWTAAHTLAVAQKLYEAEKVITYPRTEANALPEDYEPEAQRVMDSLAEQGFAPLVALALPTNQCPHKSLVFNNAQITDHFAMMPTGSKLSGGDKDAQTLYNIIVKRFISVFCPAEEVQVTTTTAVVGGNTFTHKAEVTTNPGWRAVYGKKADSTPIAEVPVNPTCNNIQIAKLVTQPPPPMTEAVLLQQMSRPTPGSYIGLGTAATRASMIEKLKTCEYIAPEGKGWVSTDKGSQLVLELRSRNLLDITNAQMTETWENRLRNIEKGLETTGDFNLDVRLSTTHLVNALRV